MALTITESVQQLYVAYFNRPAEPGGLAYWVDAVTNKGGTLADVSTAFSKSGEYTANFAGLNNDQIIVQIYENLFNRLPDQSGLAYWSGHLTAGTLSLAYIVDNISSSAVNNPTVSPADTAAITSKTAAAVAFTNFLNTDVALRLAYSTPAAGEVAKDYIASVSDATTLAAATTAAALAATGAALSTASQVIGQTYALSADVDAIVGTTGNDTINGNYNTTSGAHNLSGLDKIDGGAGNDTLNLTDSVGGKLDLKLGSVSNVETLNITSVGAIVGNDGADGIKLTTFAAGVTAANIAVAQAAALTVTAATTTALTISNDDNVTIVGGGVSATVETTGDVTIGNDTAPAAADKNAFTKATITGAAVVKVTDNSGTAGVVGSKLTTVTLDGLTGAATLTGDAIATVSVSNSDQDVSVVNTKAHALNLTVDAVETGAVVTDATATSVTVTAAGDDSAFALAAIKAATVTVAGAADLELDAAGSDYTALTTFKYTGSGSVTAVLAGAGVLKTVDASTATGDLNVTIAGTNSDDVAQSVTGGAGDDTVTITGTLGAGSTLSLGAGSDVVAIDGGVILGTAVVDAGAGTDTLSLAVVDATNVGAFKNFELFDVANATGTFDQAILDTKNSVTGFVGTDALAGALTVQNVGAGVGFTILGDMDATALTLTQTTAGALTITSKVEQAAAAEADQQSDASIVTSNATSVTLAFNNTNIDKLADYDNRATINLKAGVDTAGGATSITIQSNGTEVDNYANITGAKTSSSTAADSLTSITVTGSNHLNLDYTIGTGGALKLATVDASGQTAGGLTFSLLDLTASGTIKLGAGDDVLTATRVIDTTGLTAASSLTMQTISGLEKASAVDQTEQDGFDVITISAGVQAGDHEAASAGAYSIKDGVYTLGSGVTSLAAAVVQIATNLTGAGETVVFNYSGTNYIYSEGATTGATDDVLIKLVGTTGITGLDDDGAGHIYLVG